MIRTAVGYAGGKKGNPTYHDLGDHSETVEIVYDPAVIGYGDLLDVFFDSHDPSSGPSWSPQYASVIFYHDDDQRMPATKKREALSKARGKRISTEIVPYTVFYPAENYHQKYYLKRYGELAGEYEAIYPDPGDFVKSTAVARANGYAGGNGSISQFREEIDLLGLSEKGRAILLKIIGNKFP